MLCALVVAAPLLAGVGAPPQGAAPRVTSELQGVESARSGAQIFVVQMAEDPVVAYDGGEPGLAPTRPGRGQHVNPNSAARSALRAVPPANAHARRWRPPAFLPTPSSTTTSSRSTASPPS